MINLSLPVILCESVVSNTCSIVGWMSRSPHSSHVTHTLLLKHCTSRLERRHTNLHKWSPAHLLKVINHTCEHTDAHTLKCTYHTRKYLHMHTGRHTDPTDYLSGGFQSTATTYYENKGHPGRAHMDSPTFQLHFLQADKTQNANRETEWTSWTTDILNTSK